MPEYKIDLHMHSLISDGNTSPCKVVDTAHDVGLKKIVLTDHNSLHDNFDLFKEYAESKRVEIPFAGTELSVFYSHKNKPIATFHLLVYGNDDIMHSKDFVDLISKFDRTANELVMNDLNCINNSGEIFLSEDDLFCLDCSIAPTWKKMKYAEGYLIKSLAKYMNITYEEAENRYPPTVKKKYGTNDYWICGDWIDVRDVMKISRKLGLVTSIAHAKWIDPFYPEDQDMINDNFMFEMIADLKTMGLDGIEISHQINDKDDALIRLRNFAEQNQMICTGGSDFHGDMSGYGSHLRKYGVTDEDFEILNDLIKRKKEALVSY